MITENIKADVTAVKKAKTSELIFKPQVVEIKDSDSDDDDDQTSHSEH